MISYEFYSFGCCLYFPKQFPVVSQNETREKKNEKNKKLEINQKHLFQTERVHELDFDCFCFDFLV